MDKFQFDDGAIFAFLSYDDRTGAAIDHSLYCCCQGLDNKLHACWVQKQGT